LKTALYQFKISIKARVVILIQSTLGREIKFQVIPKSKKLEPIFFLTKTFFSPASKEERNGIIKKKNKKKITLLKSKN
jgi:hypothetical protein